jgi:hypothetical protein
MKELGGKSFFKCMPDWNERLILGAMLKHGKDMHSEDSHFLECYSEQGRLIRYLDYDKS